MSRASILVYFSASIPVHFLLERYNSHHLWMRRRNTSDTLLHGRFGIILFRPALPMSTGLPCLPRTLCAMHLHAGSVRTVSPPHRALPLQLSHVGYRPLHVDEIDDFVPLDFRPELHAMSSSPHSSVSDIAHPAIWSPMHRAGSAASPLGHMLPPTDAHDPASFSHHSKSKSNSSAGVMHGASAQLSQRMSPSSCDLGRGGAGSMMDINCSFNETFARYTPLMSMVPQSGPSESSPQLNQGAHSEYQVVCSSQATPDDARMSCLHVRLFEAA
jgi:hypothetical protein